MSVPSLAAVAALVVEVANSELGPRLDRSAARSKADGSLVTDADLAIQRRLGAALARHWPTIPLLGEEMGAHEQQRLLDEADGDGLWLLDPLDGTTNYALGFPAFCTSLALRRGGAIALGVVYDPLRDECFSAAAGAGAFLNGRPLHAIAPPVPMARGIGMVDFKRLPPALIEKLVREPPYRSQRNLGAAALEWCQVAAGRVNVYLHGQQKPWDYAAGALILAEAGGAACTLDGEPVVTPDLLPRSVVAAPTADLLSEARAWLAG